MEDTQHKMNALQLKRQNKNTGNDNTAHERHMETPSWKECHQPKKCINKNKPKHVRLHSMIKVGTAAKIISMNS